MLDRKEGRHSIYINVLFCDGRDNEQLTSSCIYVHDHYMYITPITLSNMVDVKNKYLFTNVYDDDNICIYFNAFIRSPRAFSGMKVTPSHIYKHNATQSGNTQAKHNAMRRRCVADRFRIYLFIHIQCITLGSKS